MKFIKDKKQIIIIISILLIAIVSFVLIINYKNSKKDNDQIVDVVDKLSINYINGNELETSVGASTYKFSITNNDDSERYYVVDLLNHKPSDIIKYSISSTEAKIDFTDKTFETSTIVEYAVINPGETHNYNLSINSKVAGIKIGKLNVSNYIFAEDYFAQTIISNNEVLSKPVTNPGVDQALENEGLIQDIDDYGVTYYFRGNAENNYVKFADKLWRIVRINGNNTVRLVLNDTTGDLIPYNNNDQNKNYTYQNSNLKKYLNDWYDQNLEHYDKFISTIKVCDDSSYTNGETIIFDSYNRLENKKSPTFNCLGNNISGKIMSLSADEVMYAGGMINVVNKNYYLYNSASLDDVWTISSSLATENDYYPYMLSSTGAISSNVSSTLLKKVRPVINLKKDVTVNGKGTINEPYEIYY